MEPQDSPQQQAAAPRPAIPFGWQWGLATAVGLVLAVLPTGLAALGISELEGAVLPFPRYASLPRLGFRQDLILTLYIVTCLIPGGVVGTAQWFVLRRRVPRAGWWIPATAAGLAAALGALLLTFAALSALPRVTTFGPVLLGRLAGLGIGGAAFGLLQWLPLRRWVRRAWAWIPATALGWAPFLTAFVTAFDCAEPLSGFTGCPEWFEQFVCLGPIAGLPFYIVVTSLLMAWLFAPANLRTVSLPGLGPGTPPEGLPEEPAGGG